MLSPISGTKYLQVREKTAPAINQHSLHGKFWGQRGGIYTQVTKLNVPTEYQYMAILSLVVNFSNLPQSCPPANLSFSTIVSHSNTKTTHVSYITWLDSDILIQGLFPKKRKKRSTILIIRVLNFWGKVLHSLTYSYIHFNCVASKTEGTGGRWRGSVFNYMNLQRSSEVANNLIYELIHLFILGQVANRRSSSVHNFLMKQRKHKEVW